MKLKHVFGFVISSIILFILSLHIGVLLGIPISAMARDKDTLVVVRPDDLSSTNPPESRSGNDAQIFSNIFQAPMIIDYNNAEWKNDLAKSIEIINNKDIRVKLRKTPRFSTGDPVTAHDLKFSIEQYQDPVNGYIGGFIFDEIEEVEVVDKHTAIYRFYEPLSIFRGLLAAPVMSKKYFEKVGREKFRKHPIGSGPYKFVKWKKGSSIVLERVKRHQDYKPAYKRIKFIIAPDPISRMALLQTGNADMIYEVLPHQVSKLRSNPNIHVKIDHSVPKMTILKLLIQKDKKLKDPNFIQALNHSINRKEITSRVLMKKANPVFGFFAPGEHGYDPRFFVDYNPVKAKKFLKKSSYIPGTPLILTYSDQVGFHNLVAQVLRKYFGAIGVKIVLQKIKLSASAQGKNTKKGPAGHMTLMTWGGKDPFVRLVLFHKKSSPLFEDPGPVLYEGEPNQVVIDRLIDLQTKEMVREKRHQILKKIGHEMRNYSSINLYSLSMVYAMNKGIDFTISKGLESPTQFWRVKRVIQRKK